LTTPVTARRGRPIADATTDGEASGLGDLADAVPHLVWVADDAGLVTAYNRRIADYGEVSQADDGGLRWELLVHPDDLASTTRAWSRALRSGEPYEHEHRLRMADGTYRWHLSRGVRSTDRGTGNVCWYGTATDIHEGRQAEAGIRTREERLRIAAEVADFGLYDLDLVGGDRYWSPQLRRIVGVSDETLPGVSTPIHPDDREATDELVAASRDPLGDGAFSHEYRIIRPDGAIRWVAVRGQTFFDRDEPSPDRSAVRAVGVVSDITDRRQTEEIREVFLGMLSHELRTPVTAIFGGSQLLRRPNLEEDSRREIVDDIISESERLERLVENLLVLARAERHVVEGGKDPVLVRPMIDRIVADKRRRWPDARVVVEAEPGLPPARWDESSFELVLRNLISNAIKYGADTEILVRAVGKDGDLEVTVADQGPGLTNEDAIRVFDVFYRSEEARRQAQGAGIGLFVVRALVESAGGTAWARNRPTGGAEFGFRIPPFVEDDDPFDTD
jgi:PAS domain S-box-containing protein